MRIPSIGDIVALFFTPKSVAAAVADLHRAAERVKAVVEHHRAKADQAEVARQDLISAAAVEAGKRDTAYAEADHAVRIGARLRELLA